MCPCLSSSSWSFGHYVGGLENKCNVLYPTGIDTRVLVESNVASGFVFSRRKKNETKNGYVRNLIEKLNGLDDTLIGYEPK